MGIKFIKWVDLHSPVKKRCFNYLWPPWEEKKRRGKDVFLFPGASQIFSLFFILFLVLPIFGFNGPCGLHFSFNGYLNGKKPPCVAPCSRFNECFFNKENIILIILICWCKDLEYFRIFITRTPSLNNERQSDRFQNISKLRTIQLIRFPYLNNLHFDTCRKMQVSRASVGVVLLQFFLFIFIF